MDTQDRLVVSLLGQFTMRHEVNGTEYVLTEQDSTSKRLWTFLQYLSVFNKRAVSQSELIEELWGDEDSSSNPVNALKTLLHRVRNMMEQLGFADGKDVILYRRGIYTWNPELSVELDIDSFDQLYEGYLTSDLSKAVDAIDLYVGDFLPDATGGPWAVSIRTFYHTKFLKLCSEAATELQKRGNYEDAIRICRKATVIDPFDESCHLLLMQALAASGSQQIAIQHYSKVADMFMDQLGISPSEEMMHLYRELTKAEMNVEMDLYTVRRMLEEKGTIGGAYFCEYLTFQDIYQLLARSVQRSGQVIQLVMLSITSRQGMPLDSRQCAVALEELRHCIQRSLRTGDVFTRFSASQFLILLPSANYENSLKVVERISSVYDKTVVGKLSSICHSVLPVLPGGEELSSPPRFVPIK